MKKIYDVLRQKELELRNLHLRFRQVQTNIETLKSAAHLLVILDGRSWEPNG